MSDVTIYGKVDAINYESANFLIGRLATLVDASMDNERQAKAFKDMLKSVIWESEGSRSAGIRRTLYSCKEAGFPLLPDWAEERSKAEKES